MIDAELVKLGITEGSRFMILLGFLFFISRLNSKKIEVIESDLNEIKINTAVMAKEMQNALDLRTLVLSDHDQIISLSEVVRRNKKDLQESFKKIRHLEEKIA